MSNLQANIVDKFIKEYFDIPYIINFELEAKAKKIMLETYLACKEEDHIIDAEKDRIETINIYFLQDKILEFLAKKGYEEKSIYQSIYINSDLEDIIKFNEMQNFFSDLFRFQYDYKLKIINFDDVVNEFNEASI